MPFHTPWCSSYWKGSLQVALGYGRQLYYWSKPSQIHGKIGKVTKCEQNDVSKAVRKDVKMKSYCRQRCCLLNPKSKAIRVERSPLILNHLKNHEGDVRIFVDEKKFAVDEKTNCNFQVIRKSYEEIPAVMESKHPALVIVLSAVVNDDRIMPPHFIKAGSKINTSEYVKILKEVLIPWFKKYYNHEWVMFI